MDILADLRKTLEDDFLSKQERNHLKDLITRQPLEPVTINVIRSKVYSLAEEKINEANFKFVLQWVKDVNSILQLSSANTEVYFSPGVECRDAIVRQMNLARKNLKVCVFTISDDNITHAIQQARKRGLKVNIITDNDKSFDLGSDIAQLAKLGVEIKVDVTHNHMHHKFMITNDVYVLTGSYNWTSSAAKYNHENIVVTNDSEVVKMFAAEFEKLWGEMIPFTQR